MRKTIAWTAAAAIAGAAWIAQAAEMTGTVQKVDLPVGTIMVDDQLFAVSDTNTVGATIEDLKEGEKVRVFYAESGTESGDPLNAMQIDKIEG